MFVEAAEGPATVGDIGETTEARSAETTEVREPESIVEPSISGETELRGTLSAIQKEIPREVINERVDAMLQDEAFRAEILSGLSQIEANELSQIEANRISGAAREEVVGSELAHEYPAEDGNHIERECYLRDSEGHVVKDPETGEARRIDRLVLKDGEVVKSVEVTSETADKTAQMTKEERIREAGGNYIEDRRTGELVPFRSGVKTEIERRA